MGYAARADARHGFVAQACDTVRSGHALPPFAGSFVMVRVRICTPPPHVTGHLLHFADQSETSQSTATGAACVERVHTLDYVA